DYGVWVKKTYPNPSRRSKHHATQPTFAGSRRQLRAQILRVLLHPTPAGLPEGQGAAKGSVVLDAVQIGARFPAWDLAEVKAVLGELTEEGFLICNEGRYGIV
ncbi:MAG: adenine glycosylase, partial [bacterium]